MTSFNTKVIISCFQQYKVYFSTSSLELSTLINIMNVLTSRYGKAYPKVGGII